MFKISETRIANYATYRYKLNELIKGKEDLKVLKKYVGKTILLNSWGWLIYSMQYGKAYSYLKKTIFEFISSKKFKSSRKINDTFKKKIEKQFELKGSFESLLKWWINVSEELSKLDIYNWGRLGYMGWTKGLYEII